MDRTELAWAAGFWDGEGSAYLTGALDRATRHPQARINQSSKTGAPEVLERFRRAVQCGVIKGPDIKEGREPLYRWVISTHGEIEHLNVLLWPWLGEVKRRQLRGVIGDLFTQQAAWDTVPAEERRAWSAGLWDGEGSVCLLKHRSHPGHFVPEASVTQSSDTGRPEVLLRLDALVGGGYWYGPFDQEPPWQPVYRWKLFRLSEIKSLFDLMWPWLGSVKREQALTVFDRLDRQPKLPRGNPAWGSHKTHCLRGHEYATARVRPFKGRGKNEQAPRASHQCLACVREDARARRESRSRPRGG